VHSNIAEFYCEKEIRESYLDWGTEVIVCFPCTFSRTHLIFSQISCAFARSLTGSEETGRFHAFGVGWGRGLFRLLELVRTWHGDTVQIKSFGYSPKNANRNSEVVLFKLRNLFKSCKKLVSGPETFFLRGRELLNRRNWSASLIYNTVKFSWDEKFRAETVTFFLLHKHKNNNEPYISTYSKILLWFTAYSTGSNKYRRWKSVNVNIEGVE
jgi:hypothetical protein